MHILHTINLVKYNIVIDFESMNHNHLNGLNLDITVRNKTPHKRVFLFCHKMNVFDCFWQFMIEKCKRTHYNND